MGQPLPVVQMGLPFAAATAEAARPPAGTRWARHRDGGQVLEVDDVNENRVRLAGGTVIPSHHWGAWEWLAVVPGEAIAPTVDQVDAPDPKAMALVIFAAWMAAGTRTPAQLAAKLEARGLTIEDWEAWQAARVQLDG